MANLEGIQHVETGNFVVNIVICAYCNGFLVSFHSDLWAQTSCQGCPKHHLHAILTWPPPRKEREPEVLRVSLCHCWRLTNATNASRDCIVLMISFRCGT